MTIVQNLTSNIVTSLTITSNLFTQLSTFVDNKIKLSVKYACGSSVDSFLTSISGNQYLLTPTLIGLTSFQDGIYQIILEGVTTSGIKHEERCTFIDNTLKCMVSEKVASGNIEAGILYYTLLQAQSCDCACDNLCTIFCKLNELLTNECTCS